MHIPRIWTDPPIVVTVRRADVEANDTQPTLDQLFPLVRDAEQVRDCAGRLVLSYEGYEKDPAAIWSDDDRKLWQIPELRLFHGILVEKFPFWFYFVDLSGDTLYTLSACVCRIEVRGSDTIFARESLLSFGVLQYEGMNELYREWNMPEEDKAARQEEVAQYFSRVLVE